MTVLVTYHEVRPAPPVANGVNSAPTKVKNWSDLAAGRPILGPPNAKVTIVEFGDFQCPFCALYLATIDSIRSKYPTDVSIVFVNFPLSYHKFALLAARAANCAWAQGRFDGMYHALYREQDSLGLKSWESFATDAGVKNLKAFKACVQSTAPMPSIARDAEVVSRLAVHATPAILVDGWMWRAAPQLARLDSAVKAELAK